MSLAHELRVLELDSQVELLERLQLLTNFGSNVITVGGGQGYGKSWLAQRYLEAWAEDKNQSLLSCHPNQDEQQRRATILTQIVSGPLFNPHDSLAESLTHLLDGSGCDVVIVVDDAHLLSEALISELWMLVLEAQSNPLWTINVVLFAQANSLDALLTRLSYEPVELEIEPLTNEEADRLFENLVMRYVEDNMERRIRNAYKKIKRVPGEIMALGEQKMERRIIIRSIIGSPAKIAALVVLLLLVIGGGYWWLLNQPTPGDEVLQTANNVEQTVIPTLAIPATDTNNKLVTEPAETASGSSDTSTDPSYAGAIDDSSALPPDVVDSIASVGVTEEDQQRVVIESDVVDALLEGNQAKIDNALADAQRQNEQENTTPSEQITQNVAPVKITFSFARDELKAFSPRSYTLQLAAVNSLEEAQKFIDQYQLKENIRIYPTLRNDVEWYIITYDNYPTIQFARDAVATLPRALQSVGPWAKSLSQVHREIERAK
ncbi:SPOR domain-containing protein [Vibrio sp. S12_S33]|uniref:SPOR domain-containing protein n=1 Tax=Vibrio sp. S12_S33 TaxID=2720223 RepID=UPI0017849548|nr:AAA family ATPase [Vibrio sp. S12_S33]MBD1564651.1 AAA family ATPase [Vibrio sp. S12_S33]